MFLYSCYLSEFGGQLKDLSRNAQHDKKRTKEKMLINAKFKWSMKKSNSALECTNRKRYTLRLIFINRKFHTWTNAFDPVKALEKRKERENNH